jgi:zinc finger SWIM domain-containing protein 3
MYHTSRNYFASIRTCNTRLRLVHQTELMLANVQFLLFHTLQIFNREVSIRKLGLSNKDCEVAKEYVHKLAYSRSEDSMIQDTTYSQMKDNVHSDVIDYFQKNWEPMKAQWVLYLTFNNICFLNKTNNKVENINQKLKSIF